MTRLVVFIQNSVVTPLGIGEPASPEHDTETDKPPGSQEQYDLCWVGGEPGGLRKHRGALGPVSGGRRGLLEEVTSQLTSER